MKGVSFRAPKGTRVSVAIAEDAMARKVDMAIERLLAGDIPAEGVETTVLEYIAICEAQMAKAAS